LTRDPGTREVVRADCGAAARDWHPLDEARQPMAVECDNCVAVTERDLTSAA
jgi:hypothetical protein